MRSGDWTTRTAVERSVTESGAAEARPPHAVAASGATSESPVRTTLFRRPNRGLTRYAAAGAVPTLRAGTSAGAAGASRAALERPTLVLAQSAPDSCILTGFQGPLQAGLCYFTAATYGLRFLNLKQGGSGVADREEELRILIEACCTVSPIHGDLSTNSVNAVDRARIPGEIGRASCRERV